MKKAQNFWIFKFAQKFCPFIEKTCAKLNSSDFLKKLYDQQFLILINRMGDSPQGRFIRNNSPQINPCKRIHRRGCSSQEWFTTDAICRRAVCKKENHSKHHFTEKPIDRNYILPHDIWLKGYLTELSYSQTPFNWRFFLTKGQLIDSIFHSKLYLTEKMAIWPKSHLTDFEKKSLKIQN
jgi:hypothetical protein